ncbi:hypothetical protein M8542_36415 [Amycolatopsis sp. OK19-0408]|uniref:Uncharacterized protein n=1 Tax=Amycolatopsis iheyensis TaxID=2945988 RepID=A0A9X2NKP2_9PSEU|nr:hypothetical protein [Amycolatopsis iheyensis]MCR6488329.1 hypothetical protein [Amycolatopsis iheyensis]
MISSLARFGGVVVVGPVETATAGDVVAAYEHAAFPAPAIGAQLYRHPTTPPRQTAPIKAVFLEVDRLGCRVLACAVALIVVFAVGSSAPAVP